MEALKGKKTYFTAGAAVLTALGAYFAGEADLGATVYRLYLQLLWLCFCVKALPQKPKRP